MTKSRGILTPRRFWTDTELELLREMYPECTGEDVAAWLDCTASRVYQMARKLGIEKSAEFLASDASGRVRRGKQHPNMIASRFQKGQASWNKGANYMPGGRVAEGWFKKGRPAHEARNYVPLGSHRLSKDGYLERKVTDDPAIAPARRWIAVHRLVWEAAHGPIPDGHAICFKAGQRTATLEEITADRLECVSRADLARRNHPARRDPELFRLIQLKGAITRQVNRIAREAQENA